MVTLDIFKEQLHLDLVQNIDLHRYFIEHFFFLKIIPG